jgi:hypothetical protein
VKSAGDPRLVPLKLPSLRFECGSSELPIVMHIGPGIAPRPVSDKEALRLFNELSRAIYARVHRKWSEP